MSPIDAIKREFREEREPWEQRLLAGSCADLAEYKYATGVLRGLALAEERILDLANKSERDDE